MFLIPIGHEDHNVRRLPWVTISIAVICIALRFQACSTEDVALEGVAATHDELRELLTSVMRSCVSKPDCPLTNPRDGEEIAALLREGRIGDAHEQSLFLTLDAEYQSALSALPSRKIGYQPGEFKFWRLITYMFAHGSFMHLVGNMLFLYLVGLTIEERWGRLRFLAFYLLGGMVSALAYGALHPGSMTPLVGASGAIAAAMGAFAALYARTRIKFFYFFWIFIFVRAGTFRAPAWLVLPLWFITQLLSLGDESSGASNVGYSAHAGGFAFGLLVAGVIHFAGLDRRFKHDTDIASGGWSEDLDYLDAVALAEKNDPRAALQKIQLVLTKDPKHALALELGYELSKKTRSISLMEKYAGQLYPQWSKSNPARVAEEYRALSSIRTEGTIDEHLLDSVLTAAEKLGELALAQDVMRRLYLQNRGSIRIAKALWVVAQIHQHSHREELAAPFYERIMRDYPASPWAQRARDRVSMDASVDSA